MEPEMLTGEAVMAFEWIMRALVVWVVLGVCVLAELVRK